MATVSMSSGGGNHLLEVGSRCYISVEMQQLTGSAYRALFIISSA